MDTDRIIRIIQRYQKPEGGLEQMPLSEAAPFVAGLQKAIDIIEKVQELEQKLSEQNSPAVGATQL